MGIIAGALLITSIWQYNISRKQIFEDKQEEVKKVAALASLMIDGETQDVSALGDEYELLPVIKNAFSGKISVDNEFTTDDFGTFLSGYAPIFNKKGDVVAIIGIDMLSEDVIRLENKLVFNIVTSLFVSVFIAIIISIIVSGKIVKPIRKISSKLEELAMSKGDLSKEIKSNTKDEIGDLANSLNEFIKNIKDIILQIKNTSKDASYIAEGLNTTICDNQKVSFEIARSNQFVSENSIKQAEDINDISKKYIL